MQESRVSVPDTFSQLRDVSVASGLRDQLDYEEDEDEPATSY
jgi:hypothetical protein